MLKPWEYEGVNGTIYYVAICVDGPLRGEERKSNDRMFYAAMPVDREWPSASLGRYPVLAMPETVMYQLYIFHTGGREPSAIWYCGVNVESNPQYQGRRPSRYFVDDVDCGRSDLRVTEEYLDASLRYPGFDFAYSQSYYDEPSSQHRTSGDSSTVEFELERTERCWKCESELAAEDSDTGLGERCRTQLRERYDTPVNAPPALPYERANLIEDIDELIAGL